MATQTALTVLDRHYLEIRCELLNLAATLDRIERHPQSAAALRDPRMDQIREGLAILSSSGTDRAERLQLLFSDPYLPDWNR